MEWILFAVVLVLCVVVWLFHRLSNWFSDSEVTLIAPLAPVRPTEPETVTTEEEYMALPAGSIVAGKDDHPFTKHTGVWTGPAAGRSSSEMAGKTRRVLRWGWGA